MSAPNVPELLADFARQAARFDKIVARGREVFDDDDTQQLAAEALIVKVGEIVARIDAIDPEFAANRPELDFRQLKAMRNVVAHGYDVVDADILWLAIQRDIPRIRELVSTLIAGDPGHSSGGTA